MNKDILNIILEEIENNISMEHEILKEDLALKAKTVLPEEAPETNDQQEINRVNKNRTYKINHTKYKKTEEEILKLKNAITHVKDPKKRMLIKQNLNRKKVNREELKNKNSIYFRDKVIANNPLEEQVNDSLRIDITEQEIKDIILNANLEGINVERLRNPKVHIDTISIHYLNGCTDLICYEEDAKEDYFKSHNSGHVYDFGFFIDLTGNAINLFDKPGYSLVMNNIFKGAVDKWLNEHNLHHDDICSLDFHLDTKQIFVQFDANLKDSINESANPAHSGAASGITNTNDILDNNRERLEQIKTAADNRKKTLDKQKDALEAAKERNQEKLSATESMTDNNTKQNVKNSINKNTAIKNKQIDKINKQKEEITNNVQDQSNIINKANKRIIQGNKRLNEDFSLDLRKSDSYELDLRESQMLNESKYPTVRELAFGGETGKIIDVVINGTVYPNFPDYTIIAMKLKKSTVFKNLLFKYKRELDRVNPDRKVLTGIKFKIKSEITKCKKTK